MGACATKGYRPILASLVEVLVGLGCEGEAHEYVDEALGMYGDMAPPDIVDWLGHVRMLMAAARVASLKDAERFWTEALRWNRHYNPDEEEVFTCGVVHMYLGLVRLKLGDPSGGQPTSRVCSAGVCGQGAAVFATGAGDIFD